MSPRPDPTETDERVGFDAVFTDKWIRRQKYVWMAVCAVIAAGLSGLLGRRPLAKASATAAGVEVHYERIARSKTPALLEIAIAPGPVPGSVRILLKGDFLSRGRIQRILPQPDRTELLPDGLGLTYPPPPPGAGCRLSIPA